MSMGIIRMPQNESMMCRPHGHPLLCLAEMAEWNRLATVRPNGLIEWRLMGHTMVPLTQAGAAGLHHDCSTWDELYEDDDGELVNAWNGPTPLECRNAIQEGQDNGLIKLGDCPRECRECLESRS